MAFDIDSNALTTLDQVKRHIGLTGNGDDALLAVLINQMSDRIERIAQRRFKARDWRMWVGADRDRKILLPHYPIIYINRVATGSSQALTVTYSGSEIRATAQVFRDEVGETGGIRLVSYDSSGTRTTNELSVSTNGSASAMVTAIDAVSGWDATLVADIPAKDLYPVSGSDAKSRTIDLNYPSDDDTQYRADYDTGILELVDDDNLRWPDTLKVTTQFQGLLVEARAGYETLPDDVVWLANELVMQAYQKRSHNTNLQSESLGDYSYTLANRTQINADQRELLRPYSRISVGGVK